VRDRCARQRQRISLLVDGELGLRARTLLHAHLVRCRDCRDFLARLAGVTAALRSTALGSAASAPRRSLRAYPQRLALAAGLAVVGIAVSMSGVFEGTGVGQVGALSPAQGWPVYSTPYQQEGLPVYDLPASVLQTLAS
jgi:predicted anti-sigma-YlaC factor YlaD